MLKIWTKLAKTRNKSGNIRDKIIKIKQTKFLKRKPYKIKKNRRSGKIKTTLDNNQDKKGEKLTDKTTELILSRK